MAPIGHEVGLYYDSPDAVEVGDYIRTTTGRTYWVRNVRVQERGENVGRKHIRAIVIDPSEIESDAPVHSLVWYRR